MSVLIKDMEKPKSCYAVIDGESEYCPFVNTDDDCVLLSKKGICEGTWEMQYSKCPLVEVQEPCEDAVSRADMLETYADLYDIFEDNDQIRKELNKVYDKLNALPSVTPKRKTGKWIDSGYMKVGFHCSECGGYVVSGKEKYCPNCGADMRQKEETK